MMSKEEIMNSYPLNMYPKESWDEFSAEELLRILIIIRIRQIRYQAEPIVISDNDSDEDDENIIVISSDEDEGVAR